MRNKFDSSMSNGLANMMFRRYNNNAQYELELRPPTSKTIGVVLFSYLVWSLNLAVFTKVALTTIFKIRPGTPTPDLKTVEAIILSQGLCVPKFDGPCDSGLFGIIVTQYNMSIVTFTFNHLHWKTINVIQLLWFVFVLRLTVKAQMR